MKKFRVGQKVRCIVDGCPDGIIKDMEYVVEGVSSKNPLWCNFKEVNPFSNAYDRYAYNYELVSLLTEEQWDEFLAGDLAVRKGKLWRKFLQECENMGIKWRDGNNATNFRETTLCGYFKCINGQLVWGCITIIPTITLMEEEKKMTIKDLVTGDRAVIADGRSLLIVKSSTRDDFMLVDDGTLGIIVGRGQSDSEFNCTHEHCNDYNINQIFSADGTLKWERMEEIEMTMEEVNQMAIKTIGKKVKVVEKKEQ